MRSSSSPSRTAAAFIPAAEHHQPMWNPRNVHHPHHHHHFVATDAAHSFIHSSIFFPLPHPPPLKLGGPFTNLLLKAIHRSNQGPVSIPLGTWKKFQVTSYKSKLQVPSNAFQLFACKLFQVTSDIFQVASPKLQVPKNAFQFHFFHLEVFT